MSETAYDRGYRLARAGEVLSPFQEALASAHVQGGGNSFGAGYQQGVRENLHSDIEELEHQV